MRNLNDYQQVYANNPFEDEMVLIRRENVLKQLTKHPHKNILEVGSGFNSLFNSLNEFETYSVVEPASDFFNAAINDRQAHPLKEKIFCVQEFLENYSGKYSHDYIVVSGLLHEVENPLSFLKGLLKFCNENCVVHFNVPNAKSFHRLLALEMGLIKNEFEQSENQKRLQQNSTFDLPTFQQLLGEAGFSVIDSGSYFIKPFTHAQMQQLKDSSFLSKQMIDGLTKMIHYFPDNGAEIFVQAKKK